MIVLDIFLIVLLFALFAVSHTWLASNKIKKSLAQKAGNKIALYRLFYNFIAIVLFIIFYELSPKPDIIIYELHYPFDIITFAFQVLSLFGLIWAAIPVDWQGFLGIRQAAEYFRGNYNPVELDGVQKLNIKGANKFVRHPLYLFVILYLIFDPQMELFSLVLLLCFIAYFFIGSIYEEKKLVEVFGDEYRNYQSKVPGIIPWIKIRSKHKI